MSGGHFDYKQYQLEQMADEIDDLIQSNEQVGDFGFSRNYPADIIERFRETAHALRQAAEMVQRVDWLVSSDDGEESFRLRWNEEVRGYYNPNKSSKT